MSNTVITNYTDLNGPSTKADSSVVVIVNKDGSLSVDQKLLGTLMGTDGSQGAISVVRVGHEGKPDDATDSETEDDKIPHVTLSVDSYYDEPNSIIKYDSGAEMLQSLRIETREKSLVGFHNDHCYTPLTSPSQILPQKSDSHAAYEEPVIEIVHNQLPHTPPPKPIPNSKKITILEQQILPKGKKIVLRPPSESPVILKGNNALHKPLPVLTKAKAVRDSEKSEASHKTDENDDSSSMSSSGDSIPDRDSDSDYRDTKDRTISGRVKKAKLKPRILKSAQPSKTTKTDIKLMPKFKSNKNIQRRENRDKSLNKNILEKKDLEVDLESILPTTKIAVSSSNTDVSKNIVKSTPKPVKKEKKTPAHVTALLSDMSSLFSTPDVIRRVSTDTKIPSKPEKEPLPSDKIPQTPKLLEVSNDKLETAVKPADTTEKPKPVNPKTYLKSKAITSTEKTSKGFDLIPQIDDMSLAQILQDTTGLPTNVIKNQPSISTSGTMSSPGLAGPLSPTLDLLGGLQPEEEGLTEDLLMHVAQLVESSENLQEVIDKQVLGKVDSVPAKSHIQSPFQQVSSSLYSQTLSKSVKTIATPIRKDPIEIVRRDGRVITLPPIEAPATRSSKRKSQMDTSQPEVLTPVTPRPTQVEDVIPEPLVPIVSKQYVNKKLTNKKPENVVQNVVEDKISAESQESWNSEDDPYRLWCICKQPHNNRFMICCDGCEDWFHGKCVNITKAMGQQMEEQGIEWRCPNCIKKAKLPSKTIPKMLLHSKKNENEEVVQGTLTPAVKDSASKTGCIVCKKPARASSIYCSDSCILKHAQDSLGNQSSSSKADTEPGKPQEKHKMESRVIVYERKSGRLLAGPNAPTAENLKAWLQKNPTFEVVRPGTLSTTKPNASKRKPSHEPNKIQTTLNFERIPKKISDQSTPTRTPPEVKERTIKVIPIPKEEPIPTPQPKTPVTPKSQHSLIFDTPKASTSSAKTVNEPRKIIRASTSRSSIQDKAPAVSPSTSRRKDTPDSRSRMNSAEPIRDNVRKALQEQITNRMSEESGFKFSDEEIHQFAYDTEFELHELFRDVGMKYKAKYRSLMFNIKDRKNLSLWDKICSREITPKQLVRLSPEDLASQELAQWRDKEAKYQLELIKKSELDLLAASKTYVLKTHKGEEVMETKTSVQTELDPNVPVENLVKALNDSTVGEVVSNETTPESTQTKSDTLDKKHSGKKRDREDSSSNRSRKSKRNSKRDSESRKSRSSRRKSELKEKESKGEEQRRSTRRSEKKYSREKSVSKDRSKGSKEKSDSSERSRHRSRSQTRTKRRSKSREYSRSASKGRERSRSRARSRRRSHSRETSKQRSRSKQPRSSTDDKHVPRSRSQENVYTKNKNDSTDSDSIERPKSAMLKEAHPEYDPHEPMITSAFSEEDLRKSRDDMFDESYKNDIGEYNAEYDPAKSFSIDSSVILPSTTYVAKQDKASEPESDQEPTSTVDNSAATVWNGCINMVDVARFYVAAHEVSGSATDLEEDLSTELDIVGRINPDTVWEYISKMKKASNKDIVILKLQAANDEEKMQYIALYSYLSSRNRLGVVKVSSTTTVKDFYIVPLPANTALQEVLLPLDGPGLGESSHHLLIAIVIRLRKKRLPPNIPKDIIPAKVVRESRKRSYTPPIVSKSTNSPPASPKRRVPLPLPTYTSPALSTSVKDQIAASLACGDEDEAYSPGSSSSGASASATNHSNPAASASAPASNTLRTKMDELNRQIEEQKQQILKMAQADSSVGEDEAYSPSRPMTPPTVGTLADIALPSNLQEILATIKQRTETSSNTADVDMRNMPLP